MTLRRYKRIQNQKTLVKVYKRQVNDDEIWIVLADAIEINNEKLKTKRNLEVIQTMLNNAMLNPKFRQF